MTITFIELLLCTCFLDIPLEFGEFYVAAYKFLNQQVKCRLSKESTIQLQLQPHFALCKKSQPDVRGTALHRPRMQYMSLHAN